MVRAGSTSAGLQMASNTNPCDVVDNGTGTVDLPPAGCEYLSPDEVHEIIDGLPAGTTIELDPIHSDFITSDRSPGGSLGGEIELFDSSLHLELRGTGDLDGFNRTLVVPLSRARMARVNDLLQRQVCTESVGGARFRWQGRRRGG